jgi:hypothetical protein
MSTQPAILSIASDALKEYAAMMGKFPGMEHGRPGGHDLQRRQFLLSVAAASACVAVPTFAAGALPQVDVYKSPTCGCCSAWVDHLKAAGFPVKVTDVGDTTAARKRYGLPDRFGSCHTAIVAGYVVEGHVPAAEIKRLLAMKPAAIGIAVPAMPVGSPGMEVGDRQDPYDVFLIDKNGRGTVFAHYPKP